MALPATRETTTGIGSAGGRFSRGFRQLRDARATWQILRILLIAQAVPVIWDLLSPPAQGYPEKLQQAQALLGLAKPNFLSGDFWQPLSYALIHANWTHLILNGAAILLLGSKIEHIAGKRTVRLLALSATLAGGFMFLLLSRDTEPEPLKLVGSSAVCFALLVMLTTLSPDSRFLPLFLSGRTIGTAVIFANLSLALLNPDLPTGPLAGWGKRLSESWFEGLFQVSHACHLGGSLAGYFYGKYLLRPRVTLDSLKRARDRREAAGSPEK